MEKFKINLLKQQAQVAAHERNLRRFMESERFQRISFQERQMLKKQLETLSTLNSVYRQRLKIHGLDHLADCVTQLN